MTAEAREDEGASRRASEAAPAALLLLPITEIGGADHPPTDADFDALVRCPRSKVAYLNVDTGQVIPLRCKAHVCSYCGPKNAVLTAMAQARSEPQRAIRFSNVPTNWQQARLAIKQIREAITDGGYRCELAYSLEPNPSGEDKAHAHMLQHGDFIPQAWLQEVCQRNGLGIPYIEAIRGTEATAAYGLKAAAAAFYGVKASTDTQEAYEHFLSLNGGRLSHHTRGFYRGANGETLTQGEAIAQVIASLNDGEDTGQWVIIRRDLPSPSVEAIRSHVLEGRSGTS